MCIHVYKLVYVCVFTINTVYCTVYINFQTASTYTYMYGSYSTVLYQKVLTSLTDTETSFSLQTC